MELGRSRAEVELTKKLAATLVQTEVMEPMNAMGWRHGTPPTPEQIAAVKAAQNPPAPDNPAPKGAPVSNAAPAAAPVSGQPAVAPAPIPAAVTKTDAQSDLEAARNVLALMESLRDPQTGKIMGKYNDLPEALKGAGHLANMAKGALARAEAAEARLAAAPASPVAQGSFAAPPAAAPAAAPAKREYAPVSRADVSRAQADLDKVLAKVGDGSFDGDSAREYATAVRELAKAEARADAEDDRRRADFERDNEKEKWDGINRYIAQKYPDSVNFTDEVGLHVRSNPLLAEVIQARVAQGREMEAAELAWTEFAKTLGVVNGTSRAEAERKEIELAAREQVRLESRNAALKDAGIIHGSAGGNSAVETPGVTGPSQDDINTYAAGMQREGDAPGSRSAAQWRHAVIGRFLPPELFGPGR